MLKIISGTLGVVLTLSIVIFALGVRMGDSVNTEFTVMFPYDREYLYDIYTGIENYPFKKDDLVNLEILEKDGSHITRWRENYEDSWREYEIIERNDPITFDYEIYDSSDGYTGKITHTFIESGDFTKIEMTEEGNIPSTFKRGLRFISNDDSFLKAQGKWLRVSILNEQINRD